MEMRVETTALREGTAALEEVLARLERVRVEDDLAAVGSAFRGGAVPGATDRSCCCWGERLADLRRQVRATGQAFDVTADGYEALEAVARAALGSGRTRGVTA